MFISKAADDSQQLYAELRSLAGDTRVAIDALVAAWYLEFRVRTSRTFSQWTDPGMREIAAALVFGADARPGCARLGARRALAGFSEAEIRDDLASLAQTVATDPTIEPPPSDELLAAALAGWHAASGPRPRPAGLIEDLPGTTPLLRLLGRLVDEDSEPGPIVAIVDVGTTGVDDVGDAGPDVSSALDHIEAAGPGPIGVGWFELVAGSRYAVVTRWTRGTAQALAVLRGALRVAPEFAGRPVHVWVETVPRATAALPAFVRGLSGRAEATQRADVHPIRPHRDPARPRRTRGRSRTRHSRVAVHPERWLASAAALLMVVVAVGTLNVAPVVDGDRGTSPVPVPEALGPELPGPRAEAVVEPVAGGLTGVAVGDTDSFTGAPPEQPPAPSEVVPPPHPVTLDPTPVAHVEPVVPEPTDEAADPSPAPAPAPAPPSSPDVTPAPEPGDPETPRAAPGPPSEPGPPVHALGKVPDHAPPKAAVHPSSRGRTTRL